MHKHLLWPSVVVTLLCASLPLAGQGRAGRGGPPVNLPDGAGKEVVQGLCSSCHSTNLIVNSGDYSRGYLGRFDPKTGKATEWPSPGGPKSQPYGITAYNDIIWYSESAVRPNTLVRFDPKTEKFQTWAIPSGGGVVRNMMATKEGNLVIAESGVNKVALVEVAK